MTQWIEANNAGRSEGDRSAVDRSAAGRNKKDVQRWRAYPPAMAFAYGSRLSNPTASAFSGAHGRTPSALPGGRVLMVLSIHSCTSFVNSLRLRPSVEIGSPIISVMVPGYCRYCLWGQHSAPLWATGIMGTPA